MNMADQHVAHANMAVNAPHSTFNLAAAPNWKAQRLQYYRSLAQRCNQPTALAADVAQSTTVGALAGVPAHEFYVQPWVALRAPVPMEDDSGRMAQGEPHAMRLDHCLSGQADDAVVKEAMARRSFLLVGQGGMGKTTALNQIAWQHTQARAGEAASNAPLVLLRLPAVAQYLGAAPHKQLQQAVLAALRADIQLGLDCTPEVAAALAQQIDDDLATQPGLLLFDALDEVAETQRGAALRAVLAYQRSHTVQGLPHTVIVSGRPYGFEQADASDTLGTRFARLDLMPMNHGRRQEFVQAYFAAQTMVDRASVKLPPAARNLLQRLQDGSSLAELAGTPLVLFLLCLLSARPGATELPTSRALLLDEVVKLWVNQWDAKRQVADRLDLTTCLRLNEQHDALRAALQADRKSVV